MFICPFKTTGLELKAIKGLNRPLNCVRFKASMLPSLFLESISFLLLLPLIFYYLTSLTYKTAKDAQWLFLTADLLTQLT